MNKLTVFVKLLLACRFSNYRVLGNIVCEPCQCCKDNTCPNSWNEECTSGCFEKYTGATCQDKCPDNCISCHQYSASICSQCKDGYYTGTINGQWIGNCSLQCPSNCISCRSGTSCSSCKDGLYNGLNNSIPYNNCSLTCYSGCKACTLYDVCTECKDGYFGRSMAGNYSCQHECSDGCIDNICNKENGSCICKSTYWGENCSENCRHQCKTCENYDVCNECFKGLYGPFCQYNCSEGCLGNICDQFIGTCDCKSTYWGEKCENTCSKGCNFSECSNDTGKCTAGCEAGFTGESCDTCIKGYFDEHCSRICPAYCVRDKICSNNCTDSICNRLTGECDKGCEDNYWGRYCDKECSRNCKDLTGLSNCAQSNGHCLAGCYDGYFTEQCDKNCSIYCVNTSCDNTGKCMYGCTGDFVDDLCLQVKVWPKPGISGIAATLGGSVGGSVVLIIILTVIAVVILKRRRKTKCHMDKNSLINDAVLYRAEDESLRQTDSDSVFSMPVKIRKEQDQSNTGNPNNQNLSDPKNSEEFATVCEKTVINDDLADNPTHACPSKLSQEDLTPASAKVLSQEDFTPPSAKVLSQKDITPPSATSLSKEVFTSESAKVLPLKDRASQSQKENVLELEDLDENDGSTSTALSLENGSRLTKSAVGDTSEEVLKRKISLGKLAELSDKKTKDWLEEEFEKLPVGLIKPYTESQKSDNITKNRYRGVFPYDHNRVVLKDDESDYINASYIDESPNSENKPPHKATKKKGRESMGYKKLKAYIASLGPTYKYMQDMSAFWRMVWQEKCGKIVMLTNLLEAGVQKCDQYWPEKDNSKVYADINVTCLTEEIYVEFTVRIFNVQKNSEERNVVQIHYTAWPDKGVPEDVTSLIEFRQKVHSVKTNLDGPVLVHCLAGIGRTGTYIALDILTQETEADGAVDIYACVRNLREQRVNMVQTVEQYEFLHKAVVYSLKCDSHAIDVTNFQRFMTNTDSETLAQQFQKLELAVEKRSKEEEEAIIKNKALTEKNRSGADIPGDRNRPRLYLNIKPGACDYINAVYVNSYRRVNRYILAQSPLPNTVVDFLTLVAQEKCSCIVSMEAETTKDGGVYFPANTHSWKRGSLIVRSEKVTSSQFFTHRRLKLSHHEKPSSEDRIVQHFQLTSWVDGMKCPDDAASFLDFLHHIELKSGGAEAGPVLVHCLTGAEKCGLFCVVAILLEKIQCDQQVSVVNTVRQVKVRRHRVIPNQEQYVFCHQCVNEYIQSVHVYSNFASRQ